MQHLSKLISFSVLVFSVAMGALAQNAPPGINYQGRLTRPNGTPIADGTVVLQIKIYDQFVGGSLLWQSSATTVPVKNGVFSIALSQGFDGNNNPLTLGQSVFAGGLAYLEVVPDGDVLKTLSPRQSIISVPWAFWAQTVSDNSISTAKLQAGAVVSDRLFDRAVTSPKLGLLSVNTEHLVDQAVSTAKLADLSVITGKLADLSVSSGKLIDLAVGTSKLSDGAVTTDKIANNAVTSAQILDSSVASADLAYDGNSMVKVSAGRASIGGTDFIVNGAQGSGVYGGLLFDQDQTPVWGINHYGNGLNFHEYGIANARLFLARGGNVGIGTSIPGTALDVAGNIHGSGYVSTEGDVNVGRNVNVNGDTHLSGKLGINSTSQYPLSVNGIIEIVNGALILGNAFCLTTNANEFIVNELNTKPNVRIQTPSSQTSGFFVSDAWPEKIGGGSGDRWFVASDRRLKKNIRTIANPLDIVLSLQGREFEYRDQNQNAPGTQYGFIAQEVERVVPRWVAVGTDGMRRLGTGGIEAIFVETFKAQQHAIARLEARHEIQDRRINDLERRLRSLEIGLNQFGLKRGK